ncbi:hypothetical protein HF086_001812 [Spodoptera exigua]|uniref:Uncharacterized protein n=1 Tax=Spodoptera exigua TaxID=7107 RepID=A0A922MWD6_SPOEX|nr:hypothetical protein HF086_001812 [Spodoptera exigua]
MLQSHPRSDVNICTAAQLRVMLPTSVEHNMPPPFIDINNIHDIPPPQADFSAPPPYDVAANSKLPTYEEVQREKQMEGEDLPQMQGPPPNHPTFAAFVTVEPTEGSAEQLDPENSLLGTDIMFLTSFFGIRNVGNITGGCNPVPHPFPAHTLAHALEREATLALLSRVCNLTKKNPNG